MSSKHSEKEQTARAPDFQWGASHDFVFCIIKYEDFLLKEKPETAAATCRRQRAWQQIDNWVSVKLLRAYDTNYAWRSHEISVLRHPCMYNADSLVLSDATLQVKKNKHNNIIQNSVLSHLISQMQWGSVLALQLNNIKYA